VIADLQRRIVELRFVEGIEKVEHVPFPTGDQFWVRFNHPLDFTKLETITKSHGCYIVKFAGLPSKLPRGLSEMLSDGVTHVITKKISWWINFSAKLGSEPDGIAKIATDLHGPYEIFMATEEEGVQIVYEYLGVTYTPPEPPKPTTPIKPAVLAVARPTSVPPKPATEPLTPKPPVQ
jgi:hypothetical protein